MGCSVSQDQIHHHQQYSVPIGQQKAGESEIRRHIKCENGLVSTPDAETTTLKEAILRAATLYKNRPCLGRVVNEQFEFTTYEQTLEQAKELGSGITNMQLLKPEKGYHGQSLQFVGVFSKNRVEWATLDIANILYGFSMVPFYDTLGPDSIPFILEQTNLQTMFMAADQIKSLIQIENKHNLKYLVFFDPLTAEQKQLLEKKGYVIIQYEDVLANGRKSKVDTAVIKPQSVYTLCYTSGTTGNPKGAMLSHGNLVSALASLPYADIKLTPEDVHLSYLPLPHVMERLLLVTCLYNGVSIGFYRGDPNLLKEDIAKLRPTIFMSVPRLYNRFYDGIKAKIEAVTGLKKSFADRAVTVKLENLHSSAQYKHSLYDKAFEGVRELFGGRCRLMITGSAPIQREVIDFLKVTACCPIYEGYGQTESSAGSFITAAWDPTSGHVGGPTANTEFKLVDVPEMNYTSQDIQDGKSTPRGEICFRGNGIFLGYYKDEEKTKEAIDPDGWLHSGDIGMLLPNGSLKIIDRKKNIFKLSQGEYIAPEKIEAVYNRAPGVAESYVYGDSLQNFCVAIIVPKQDYIEKYAADNGLQGNFEELCQNPKVNKQISENIAVYGKSNKLNSLEIVKMIYLEPKAFQLHGCCTSTLKLQRHQVRVTFQKKIDELYANWQGAN